MLIVVGSYVFLCTKAKLNRVQAGIYLIFILIVVNIENVSTLLSRILSCNQQTMLHG